jgi:hypothetical protein
MIDLEYLKDKLIPRGFELEERGEMPMFYKRVNHKNGSSIYAFSLIMVSFDKYTVTIEGFNEILITRAIKANVISIETYEELAALREIVYDDTHEIVKRFETMLNFLEMQLEKIVNTPINSEEHQNALHNIELMVNAAKSASYE